MVNFRAYISTKPANKAVGSDKDWEHATKALINTVEKENLPYEIDEGGGAFYGPKIDLKLLDVLGREWQLSTVQFDFNLPTRFGLEYIGADGNSHTPYMVHRALFGSVERFFAMLIEHYKGDLPLWLAPTQVVVIPIADKYLSYAQDVTDQLKALGMRVEIDDSSERMQAKIRNSELQKIPLAIIIGEKEVDEKLISVRSRAKGDLGQMTVESFCNSQKEDLIMGTAKILS